MAPDWTKQIRSETICSVYWYIYVIYAVIAVFAILGTVGILFAFKLPKVLIIGFGFQGLLTASIAATLALFQYLVCDRALLQLKKENFSNSMDVIPGSL